MKDFKLNPTELQEHLNAVIPSIKNLLAAKVYCEIPHDPELINNNIQPKALLNAVYGVNRKAIKRWKIQDKISKGAKDGTPAKTMTLILRCFVDMIINRKMTREQKDVFYQVEAEWVREKIETDNLEYIKMVGLIADRTCKTNTEKIEFYREYLVGMERYKNEINETFTANDEY